MVAEKSGMYSWGDNKFIDFFVSWVGTRPLISFKEIHTGVVIRSDDLSGFTVHTSDQSVSSYHAKREQYPR